MVLQSHIVSLICKLHFNALLWSKSHNFTTSWLSKHQANLDDGRRTDWEKLALINCFILRVQCRRGPVDLWCNPPPPHTHTPQLQPFLLAPAAYSIPSTVSSTKHFWSVSTHWNLKVRFELAVQDTNGSFHCSPPFRPHLHPFPSVGPHSCCIVGGSAPLPAV